MITLVYVIDTGYLLELFSVPGASSATAIKEIKRRYEKAIKNNSRFYVPFPCICEVGNRITRIGNGRVQRKLALNLCETVKSSFDNGVPWIITPFKLSPSIDVVCKAYAKSYAVQSIGLTDTVVIEEAKRLKKKYSGLRFKVHIWTKDKEVKALEPEHERNCFLGC